MKRYLGMYVLSVISSAMLTEIASASTIHDFGTIPTSTYSTGFSYNPGSGMFTNDYTFVTQLPSLSAGSVTNSFSIAAEDIQNLMISIFSGVPAAIGMELGSGMGVPTSGTSQQANVSATGPAGSYFFRVTGTSLDNPNYSLSVSFNPSFVPLPSSLPMFGGALLALAGFSYGMNRWVATKSKVAEDAA